MVLDMDSKHRSLLKSVRKLQHSVQLSKSYSNVDSSYLITEYDILI